MSTPSRPPTNNRTPGRTPGRTPRGSHNTPSQLHQGSGVPHGHVPAYLPGSASLVEELDQRVMIVLRDGKHLVGNLCSYDQFSNLVLRDSFERRIVVHAEVASYHDIPLGIYVVRGDTVVLMGRVPEDQDQLQQMKAVSLEELGELKEKAGDQLEWDFDTDLTA